MAARPFLALVLASRPPSQKRSTTRYTCDRATLSQAETCAAE
jgi:hypothetical protein